MQQFINNIIIFINSIYEGITTGIAQQMNTIARDKYISFLATNVFTESSLIGVNITWEVLLRFIPIWILLILFIVLFVKFVLKLVSIFRV